ncbi:MAG: aminotransferase class V-fold PLP-dependent enzyme [Paucibacter sp.]|nr:aminotransferase class V-fold PLP-dependent enzyme [Roseateles sp.]
MREEFLLDPGITFLNHGSYGACPRPVLAEQQRWREEMERNPVEFLTRRSGALLKSARSALAQYLGAQTDHLIFIPNATTAVNAIAASLRLAPGDEVLSTDLEYGACDMTWRQHCERQGAVLQRVQIPLPFEPQRFVERMMEAATKRTRLIFVSHITSVTALIFPVAELCRAARERGILVCIDGAHAPSQIDLALDEIGADFYSGNCHKWLCAPKGAAFLHVRPEHHEMLRAPVISWGWYDNPVQHSYTGETVFERRFQWQGTHDITPWLSVPAAIAFQAEREWARRRAECHALAIGLMHEFGERHGLAPIAPDECFGQMAPLPVPHQDAPALRARLFDEHRIEVPVTEHGDRTFVRVSMQAYNTAADLQRLSACRF